MLLMAMLALNWAVNGVHGILPTYCSGVLVEAHFVDNH